MDVKILKNKLWKKVILPLLAIALTFLGVDNFTDLGLGADSNNQENSERVEIIEDDSYNNVQEVVEYIHQYEELPENYLTKKEARDLGWVASEGNLWDLAPGASIGGDYFGNFEGLLPGKEGRDYQEADINYQGGYRDGERLIYSNDGLYFYTEDHYESFDEIIPGGGSE